MNREEEFMRRSHKLINKLIDTADELGMCLVGGFYFRKKTVNLVSGFAVLNK